MENEPETFDLCELVGDIADALCWNQKLWPKPRRSAYDHGPERDRFWPIAKAVAERFQRGRYKVVMAPPTRGHSG